MQWETATPVGFPVCVRHNDCRLKKKGFFSLHCRCCRVRPAGACGGCHGVRVGTGLNDRRVSPGPGA